MYIFTFKNSGGSGSSWSLGPEALVFISNGDSTLLLDPLWMASVLTNDNIRFVHKFFKNNYQEICLHLY